MWRTPLRGLLTRTRILSTVLHPAHCRRGYTQGEATHIDPVDVAHPVLEPQAPHELADDCVEPRAQAPTRHDHGLHFNRVEVNLRSTVRHMCSTVRCYSWQRRTMNLQCTDQSTPCNSFLSAPDKSVGMLGGYSADAVYPPYSIVYGALHRVHDTQCTWVIPSC